MLTGRGRRAAIRLTQTRWGRRAGVAVSRRYPAVRSAAQVLLGREPRAERIRPLDIRPGRMFTGERQGRRLPVVVLVAVGLGQGDAARLAEAVERAQLTSGTFRPLFVVDGGDLAAFRSRGYAVEAVMPKAAFGRVNPHEAWTEYLYERVAAIASAYGARSVVPLDANDRMLPDHVLRLVGAVAR